MTSQVQRDSSTKTTNFKILYEKYICTFFFLFIIILTIILTSTWPSKVKFFLKKVKSKNERKQVKNLWNILICNVYDLYYNQLNQRREAKCLKLKLFTCLNQKFFQDPIIWDHED